MFPEVTRTGSVRWASEALQVSQPAVSAALSDLQRHLGATLLERAGRVRLAAVTTAAESLLPGLQHGFRERERALRIELDEANRERIWDRLGRLPVVLACRTLAVRRNALVVVTPPGTHPDQYELTSAQWLLRSIRSHDAIARDLAAGDLAVIPTSVTPLERDWCVVTNAERGLTAAARRFRNFALESGVFAPPQAA